MKPYVESSLRFNHGRMDALDVFRFLTKGEMLAWIVWHDIEQRILGVVVVDIIEYPKKKVFEIAQCAGEDIGRWIHLLAEFEEVAMSLGCSQMTQYGRSGWGRVLGAVGWEPSSVSMMKRLPNDFTEEEKADE